MLMQILLSQITWRKVAFGGRDSEGWISQVHTQLCACGSVYVLIYSMQKHHLDDGLDDTGMFLGADDTGMNEKISSGPLRTYVPTKHHFRIHFHSCDLI